MKDKQIEATPASTSIPIISPLLHIICIPLIVFLRYGFGYSYLRPKAVLLALAWASFLMSYIVWKEPSLHGNFGSLAILASAASSLYLLHLIWSTFKEGQSQGDHDSFSGHSIILIPFRSTTERTERFAHILIEPVLAAVVGLVFALMLHLTLVGWILGFTALCLFFKEIINAWLSLRKKKLMRDKFGEAEETVEEEVEIESVNSGRKPRQGRIIPGDD